MIATASDAAAREERRLAWVVAPVAVGILAAGLSALSLTHSLGLSEIEEVLEARRPWSQLVPFAHADASGSAFVAALAGWLHVGSADWAVRVPSVVAVALACVCVYFLAARLFDRLVGLVAGAALATSQLTVDMGSRVGALALAILAVSLASWLFVVAAESGRGLAWASYTVVAVAAVFVHASCAFVIVAHAAATPWLPRVRARAAAVCVALAAVLAVPAVVQALDGRRHLLDVLAQPDLADVGRAVHVVSGRNVVVLALALCGVVLLALGVVRGGELWKIVLLAIWAAAPLVGVLLLSIARPSLDARYLAVSAPALAVLAAVGLLQLPRRELVAAVAVAALAVSGVRIAQDVRSTPEDWSGAVTYALATREPGDRVVVAPARALAAFSYYAGKNRGSRTAGGQTDLVVVRADTQEDALEAARGTVRPPAYALLDVRPFGRNLWVQRWERTGLR